MSSAKTVTYVILLVATSAAAVRADEIAASGNSWVFFGNPSTFQAQFPTLAATSGPTDPWQGVTTTTSSQTSTPPTPVTLPPPPAAPACGPRPVLGGAFTPVPPSSTPPANAFINFGTASYPELSQLTTGTAAPWYTSPSVTQVFGGVPNSAQQVAFENQVLQDVQHTFSI